MRETTRTILTAVTVATVMALLLPVGAQAAGQLMTIVDADSQAKAQVEGGKLRVGDGNGALTVNGALAARPALPADPFSVTGTQTSSDPAPVVSLGRGRIAVTDVVVSHSNTNSEPMGIQMQLWRTGDAGNCSALGGLIKTVLPYNRLPANETLAIQLSTPVVATARPVCLVINADNSTGRYFVYTITGYRT